MNSNVFKEICSIISGLQIEFSTEEEKLLTVSREHTLRIDELEQEIVTCRKNEDIDFRVFSPRNITSDQSDKIKILEEEKSSLERERREAEKQISYYSGKAEKLSRVLDLLKGIIVEEGESVEDNNNLSENESDNIDSFFVTKKKSKPFSFIENLDDIEDEDDNTTDNSEITVEDEDVEDDLFDSVEEIVADEDNSINTSQGIPVDCIKKISHKTKVTEKIIKNDYVRARMELKEIISELDELIIQYSE